MSLAQQEIQGIGMRSGLWSPQTDPQVTAESQVQMGTHEAEAQGSTGDAMSIPWQGGEGQAAIWLRASPQA